MKNMRKQEFGGGATLLGSEDKGSGGIGCVKLLRYYGTKALRSNRNVGWHYKTDTKIDKGANTNYNSNMTNYNSENKTVSEAQSKELNVLTSYRLNDFKKKAAFTLAEGATHVAMSDNIRRVAFTLAEVLITLGIIGIVAAMTIPTLVSKIQEAHFHAKWKECYAILNNAFKMTVAENPGMVASVELDAPEFFNTFLSHLQVVDTCGFNSNFDNLCDNYFNYKDSQIKYKWAGVSAGSSESKYKTLSNGLLGNFDFQRKAALLKNGASIYFGGSHSGFTILVDVNNFNGGPNVIGKDVYGINLYSGEDYRMPMSMPIEKLIFLPHGASGARCTDGGGCSLGVPDAGFGVNGCSEDIGAATANYFVEASGAGCSYKYLHEK